MVTQRNIGGLHFWLCMGVKSPNREFCLVVKTVLLAKLIFLVFFPSTQLNAANIESNIENEVVQSEKLKAGAHGPRLRSENLSRIDAAQASISVG